MDSASYRTISAKPKRVTVVTERQPATQSSSAGPRSDGVMLIAARVVRADPEAETIPRRRQSLVADRHRRVHM
jgi:hypothetical protein